MILSALVLFAYFWVVDMIHEDYLNYLDLRGESTSAGLSFLVKWLAFALGITIYWMFNSYARKKYDKKSGQLTDTGASRNKPGKSSNGGTGMEGRDDPFDEIRRKGRLRSRGDLIIDKNRRN